MGLPSDLTSAIEWAKITQYLLDLSSPDGASKARFFMAHGFSAVRPQELKAALLGHAGSATLTATLAAPYGTKYVVECQLSCPDAQTPCIRTVWISEDGATARLVTAYPK